MSDHNANLYETLYQKLAELEANIKRDQAMATKIRELLGLLVRGGHLKPSIVTATAHTGDMPEELQPGRITTTTLDAVLLKRGQPTNAYQISKKARIEAEITKVLQGRESVHRTEILSHLKAVGLMGTEKDPMRALAIYLSGFDGVETAGDGEWRLRGR